MGTVVLTDAKLYCAQFNFSSDLNRINLTIGSKAVEDLTFGQTFETTKSGLRAGKIDYEGFVQYGSGSIDDALTGGAGGTNRIGLDNVPVSAAAEGGNAGDVGFFMQARHAMIEQGAKVGEMLALKVNAEASGAGAALVRGTIMEDGKTARTTAGNSTARQLGAVTSSQKVYAALHVFAFTGTSVTFKVRSAVTNFATITDRIAFTAADGPGAQYAYLAGAITDTFWRVDWTGTFTSFQAAVLVGIQ